MIADFEFHHPWVLAVLAALPLYALLTGNRGRVASLRFPSTETARLAGTRARSSAGRFRFTLRQLALACLIVACAGPRLVDKRVERRSEGIDIMLALDLSPSMHALDMSPPGKEISRASAAKSVIADFVAQRPDDRIGLLAFARTPFLASPLTLNHDWITRRIGTLNVGSVGDGTALGDAVAMASDRLKNRPKKGSRVIILLTDGDDNSSRLVKPVPAAEIATGLGIRLYTIGIGKDESAALPMTDEGGRPVHDASGRIIPVFMMPPANYTLLGRMAVLSGGKFYRAKDTSELRSIYDDIGRLETSEVKVLNHVEYTELFAPLVFAAIALLLAEILLAATLRLRVP